MKQNKKESDDSRKAKTRPFPDADPEIALRIAMDRFQSQRNQVDTLDSKIGNLLGFSGILIAIMAGFLASNGGFAALIQSRLLCTSGAIFVSIAIVSLVAYFAKGWETGPVLNETWDNVRQYGDRDMSWWAAESFTKSFENNKAKVNIKVRAVKADIILIVVQAATLFVGLTVIRTIHT